MPIHALIKPSEWYIFNEEVKDVASSDASILGVLAMGSLIQTFLPPANFYEPRRPGPYGEAYEQVRNPNRRKVYPSNSSDLDIWVCTEDTLFSSQGQAQVDLGAIALLGELASGTIRRGTPQWSQKKAAAFGSYYKKPEMYDRDFTKNNPGTPWMAEGFKSRLEGRLQTKLPEMCERLNKFTSKQIPGDFLEIRAFPQSLFNLRPDDVVMESGTIDRQPFPRIADDQWISPSHASYLLYNSGKADIYPFDLSGRTLGAEIAEYIIASEQESGRKSYGGILIKPDTFEKGQLGIVKQKIDKGLKKINGRIVTEKIFEKLSEEQIAEIYPLLRGSDLAEATKYLQSSKVLVFIIESDFSAEKTFKAINAIKGPRVGDRTEERLLEGRKTNGGIRDLLPLPGDEDLYRALIPKILARKKDPSVRFSDEEYSYYARNLVHTPDNIIELRGLLKLVGMPDPNE